MSQLRPKGMTTEQFSSMMKQHGFPACSRAAISLAERPNESGVQFTQRFRNAAQDLLNAPRRRENRKNGNKTTVWLDDELREWVETRAYMDDVPVGEFIRGILREARTKDTDSSAALRMTTGTRETDCHGPKALAMTEKAASDAATPEAAEMVPNDGRADVGIGPYGHPDHNTFERGKQDETL